MYNPDLKERFIASVTESENTATVYRNIFRLAEPYESKAGLDLCQMDAETGTPLANKLAGVSGRSVNKRIDLAQKYVRWCVENGVPGAGTGFLNVKPNPYQSVLEHMVSGPIMLGKYLDDVFERPDRNTVHNVYRLYMWLGFIGFPWRRLDEVKTSHVDTDQRVVAFDGASYSIPEEALPVFENCVSLNYFNVPRYSKLTPMPRAPGTRILRGLSDDFSVKNLAIKVSANASRARKMGKTTKQISYEYAGMSGLFYRAMNDEIAGVEISFREEAENLVKEDTEYREGVTGKWAQTRIGAREIGLKQDYERWKLAFFV